MTRVNRLSEAYSWSRNWRVWATLFRARWSRTTNRCAVYFGCMTTDAVSGCAWQTMSQSDFTHFYRGTVPTQAYVFRSSERSYCCRFSSHSCGTKRDASCVFYSWFLATFFATTFSSSLGKTADLPIYAGDSKNSWVGPQNNSRRATR